jgi:pimeloyl-ACP methyl ester carboxylesterase
VIGHLFTNSTSGLADRDRRVAFRDTALEAAEKIRSGGLAAMERIPVHPRHGWKLPKPVYEALVADAASHDPAGIANTIGITNPAVSMRERLADNTRPACLIQGIREKRFAPMAEAAEQAMPGLEIVRLDAGHGMNMEAARPFNEAVLEFMRRCQSS